MSIQYCSNFGFLQERRFKELFDTIPSLDDLYALETEGLRPNVILVNMHKDKKLSMLKQLTLTLVKGLSSTPAVVVKKIAGLVRHLLFCCLYWGLVLVSFLFLVEGMINFSFTFLSCVSNHNAYLRLRCYQNIANKIKLSLKYMYNI